eukprot:TRINITY_DN8899_c0_g1_i2.p1 TRINITY_DN8899_c0_g1~~TRINITY_DN8899_c0_g1_i2.p1  ORF type:complete len:483 (-),score=89.36 TRINITY_DN8899_c0_g1_i2:1077-2525(-)
MTEAGIDDFTSVRDKLRYVLSVPTLKKRFVLYLDSVYSVELILFFDDAEEFSKISETNVHLLQEKYLHLMERYLLENSPYQINVSNETLSALKNIESPQPTVFNEAKNHVFSLMASENFQGFLRTHEDQLRKIETKVKLPNRFYYAIYRLVGVTDNYLFDEFHEHKVFALKSRLEKSEVDEWTTIINSVRDITLIASLLKAYLATKRTAILPPLITFFLSGLLDEGDEKIQYMHDLIHGIPPKNQAILHCIFALLKDFNESGARGSELSNLTNIFVPLLINNDGNVDTSELRNSVAYIIKNIDQIFDGPPPDGIYTDSDQYYRLEHNYGSWIPDNISQYSPNLTLKDWKILQTASELLVLEDPEILLNQGDKNEYMYRIKSLRRGMVNVSKRKDGVDIKLGTLSKGSMFGEISIISSTSIASATITASAGVQIERYRPEFIWSIFDNFPTLTGRFFYTLVKNLADRLVKHTVYSYLNTLLKT